MSCNLKGRELIGIYFTVFFRLLGDTFDKGMNAWSAANHLYYIASSSLSNFPHVSLDF